MTSLDTLELDDKLGCLKGLLDFNVDGATDSVSCIETEHIVVEIDVNGAIQVQV